MAEESLAFYVLVITVMVAAATTRSSARRCCCLAAASACWARRSTRSRQASPRGFAGVGIDEGLIGRVVILVIGTAIGIWWVMRYAAKVKADARGVDAGRRARDDRRVLPGCDDRRDGEADDERGASSSSSCCSSCAFVVMIIGVIPWADLAIELSRRGGGGSPR